MALYPTPGQLRTATLQAQVGVNAAGSILTHLGGIDDPCSSRRDLVQRDLEPLHEGLQAPHDVALNTPLRARTLDCGEDNVLP